jgi:hypothetical protein
MSQRWARRRRSSSRGHASGSSPRDLGRRICEAKVPIVPLDTPIVLKPNLGGFDWFKDPAKNDGDDGVRGRITNPEFVRGVVRCLKARGHARVTIAEGWGAHHADWVKLVKVSGYEAMAHEEGVPLVAIDALRAGIPVVASNLEGIASVVRHRDNGLLVEPGDEFALALALALLECDDVLLRSLRRGATKSARTVLSWSAVAGQLRGVYEGYRPDVAVTGALSA